MLGASRAWRASLGTVALVLVLVLLGVGGALLADHAGARSSTVIGSPPSVSFSLPATLWGVLFLAPLLVGLAGYLVRLMMGTGAAASGGSGISVVPALVAVVVVALLLLALLLATFWGGSSIVTLGATGGYDGGPGGQGSGAGGGGNGTGAGGAGSGGGANGTGSGTNGTGSGSGGGANGTNGSGTNGTGSGSGGGPNGTKGNGTGNGTGNSTGGTGGSPPPPHKGGSSYGNNSSAPSSGAGPARGLAFGLPNWLFGAIAALLCVFVGVLAVPGVLSRLVDPRRPGPVSVELKAGPAEARLAFRDARLSIEAGESPRGTIVRLYGRLLGRVGAGVDELASSTAEEIQRTRLAELRVPSERSEAITQMFEEACYSAHPIGPPTAERFVDVLRAVDRDLSVGALR